MANSQSVTLSLPIGQPHVRLQITEAPEASIDHEGEDDEDGVASYGPRKVARHQALNQPMHLFTALRLRYFFASHVRLIIERRNHRLDTASALEARIRG